MSDMNAFQRIAIGAYADGEFSHIEEHSFGHNYGDTLFAFVLTELSEKEDCDSLEEAVNRMRRAVRELQEVADALDFAQQNQGDKT